MMYPRSLLIGLACLISALVCPAAQAQSKGKDRVDAVGDPLPEGALMRFGSNRLRHSQPISTAAFSPDSRQIASAGHDGRLRIWNTADGREVADLLLTPPANVFALRFSPDGSRIAAASSNFFAVFDVAAARQLWRENNQNILGIAWSSDSKRVAATRSDSVVRIVEAQTGKLEGECVRQNSQLTTVTFAAGDKELLAAAADYTIRRFDTATGKLLGTIPFPGLIARNRTLVHPRLTFSPDGSHLALCDSINGFWLWPVAGEARSFTSRDVTVSSISVSISSDNRFVATGNADGTATVWGIESGKVLRTISASRFQNPAVLSPDARRLASFSNSERNLRLWNLDDYQPIGPPAPPGDVFSAILIDDGKTVVTGANQGHLIAWDVASGKIKDRYDNRIGFLTVGSPDGKIVRAIDQQQRSIIWKPGKKGETKERSTPPIRFGFPIQFAANGEWIAMRAPTGQISLCECESGKEIKAFRLDNRTIPFQQLRMSPDNRWLAAIDNQRMVWTWEVAGGRFLPSFGPLSFIAPVTFSPDGRLLLTIDPNAYTLWETSSGRARARIPRAANTPFSSSLAVSRDQRLFLAGNGLGELTVHDVMEKTEIRRIAAHKGAISHIICPPSGNRFLTLSSDGTVLAWDADLLAAGLPAKPLPAENVREWMTDLSSLDAEKAGVAVRLLAAYPDATLKHLRTLAKPPVDETVKKIADLIQRLDHPRFKVREDATKELGRYGVQAKSALEEAVKNAPSEDAKVRMENLLKRIQGGAVSAESLSELRLIEVLERIGANEARDAVAAMSKADTPAGREAKAVLERWRKE